MHFEELLLIAIIFTGAVSLLGYFKTKKKSLLQGTEKVAPKGDGFFELCRSAFPVLVIVFLLRSFLFEPFRIPSGSMRPTLLEGDFILVNKFAYGVRLPVLHTELVPVAKPKVGDIIIFRHFDGKDMIKRVIGLPGDRIRYNNKQLYINDVLVPTTFIAATKDYGMPATKLLEHLDNTPHDIYVYPYRINQQYAYDNIVVPPDSYFVMGDNRDNSLDGRFWGFVHNNNILGKAIATWMSWDSESNKAIPIRWNRIGKSVYSVGPQ